MFGQRPDRIKSNFQSRQLVRKCNKWMEHTCIQNIHIFTHHKQFHSKSAYVCASVWCYQIMHCLWLMHRHDASVELSFPLCKCSTHKTLLCITMLVIVAFKIAPIGDPRFGIIVLLSNTTQMVLKWMTAHIEWRNLYIVFCSFRTEDTVKSVPSGLPP